VIFILRFEMYFYSILVLRDERDNQQPENRRF